VADAEYEAWLVDLDGTLYTQRWVRLAMAVEVLLFGRSALAILRRFRREQETQREELQRGEALAIVHESPYAAQLARTAEALGAPVEHVEGVVLEWMFVRPQKWIRRFLNESLLRELRAFKAGGARRRSSATIQRDASWRRCLRPACSTWSSPAAKRMDRAV